MEAKAILATRVRLNELAANHNKLTTLVAVMLSEIQHMKEDMDNIKNLLENVEVVSEETTPSKPVQQPVRQQPVVQQNTRQTITPTPVSNTSTTTTSSGRTSSRNRRNQTFAEIQADDIIKQLTMNSD